MAYSEGAQGTITTQSRASLRHQYRFFWKSYVSIMTLGTDLRLRRWKKEGYFIQRTQCGQVFSGTRNHGLFEDLEVRVARILINSLSFG